MKRVVIKIGTSSLTKGSESLSRRQMLEFARQMARLHDEGMEFVLVSSGAVAAGREVLHGHGSPKSLPSKQMLASVGIVRLMDVWTELFGLFEIPVGQVLLTRHAFGDRQSYLNIRDTLNALLDHRMIPIVNENDAVSTPQNKVGDNDNLSALVANMIAADLLLLLTDQDGLYTADPRLNPDAKPIKEVRRIDENLMSLAESSSHKLGTGGMSTKLEAATLATQSGTPTVIASATRDHTIEKVCHNEPAGTYFYPQTTPRESRKRWLLSERPQGKITLDRGAVQVVHNKGASLLAVGITKTTHPFERGAVVQLISEEGRSVAVGLSNYSSEEIEKLIGTQSHEIVDCLGYSFGDEIVHRDNMVVLA